VAGGLDLGGARHALISCSLISHKSARGIRVDGVRHHVLRPDQVGALGVGIGGVVQW
jgi:hypothetical protein